MDYTNKKVKVAWLSIAPVEEKRWKVMKEDNELKDWWLCIVVNNTWKVIKIKNIIVEGKNKTIPTMLQA